MKVCEQLGMIDLHVPKRQKKPSSSGLPGVPINNLAQAVHILFEVGKKHGIKVSCQGHAGDGNIHPHSSFNSDEEKKTAAKARSEFHHKIIRMGVSKQPRGLIRSIPGLRFTEMNRADVCCGYAGTFSATHYGLSQQILADKAGDIMATGADVVVTGCSACKMQILDGIAHKNARTRVLHTAELLAKAYGL